ISKGFAVAQAAVALAQNVAEASKVGFPQNLPLIAAAFAQGAQITAILSGANFRPGGYADGGYTGPGGKYQPAGIVHKGEGVLSQEDIRALGGPAAFYALRHAIHNGYADGGLVMPTERAEPLARLHAPAASPVNMRNAMRLYLYQDIDQLAAAVMSHPATEKKLIATVGDNGQAIQASWGNG
ncbi:MAG TPA: DNA-binding protein, partial [Pseudoxanthomonas sp.]